MARSSKEPLIKASSAASWSFSRLFEPLFPHLSSDRLREIVSKIHRPACRDQRLTISAATYRSVRSRTINCLRFRQASFNQRFPKSSTGFTLLEVCLAIFIALLVISVAIPSLSGVLKGNEAENAFQAFNDLVRKARRQSLEERRAYVLEWTKEAVIVRPDEGDQEEVDRLPLEKDDSLALQLTAALRKETQPIWTFWPTGVCEPATVTFAGKNGIRWSAVFHPLTAEATVSYE